ncbi:hypothetical protein AG1IA_02072 [Rhizoctonia solani AG-1 IA]|uniref:Uncharacterized protein n=1 Tax=Thanatephorus cucumeris (strain AG1-IA) TaxID=983506 RepID=L8X446_THACA|nr:hypothetical protein AG1IA_02072 [Rhizoctonia solani AG-1 IA]
MADVFSDTEYRPDTPEPFTHQGRRNLNEVQLLDDDGAVSQKFMTALAQIFSKYCTPRPPPHTSPQRLISLVENAWMEECGLDDWARDTNGAPFPDETKEEMKDTLDVDDQGNLTYVCLFESVLTGLGLMEEPGLMGLFRYISCRLRTMKKRRGGIL